MPIVTRPRGVGRFRGGFLALACWTLSYCAARADQGDTERAMSQENVEVAKLVNAAFNRGEVEVALEVFAPDAELLDLQNAPDQPAAIEGLTKSATR
jgi:hypothetical protein